MASKAKKWVAFRTNAKIPAVVLGSERDEKVNAKEPVLLPAGYADHVVHDRFADFCKAPAKSAPKKKAAELTAEEKAAAETAKALEDAKQAVSTADLHLKSVEGTPEEDAAREALKAAEEALAALQPAS
ncbi:MULTISPECIES: hypothetical protein [Phaeobacter]|uniref:hypothetical protein n=1 Tax=Phaeobacter TaxID=302485 RepID=UPI00058AE64C|nr:MULTISPECIES: hypothetical protein [Phaeobacter]AUQ89396.1 hypothetical protein PhaeoP24_00750 [Phaeobacter inhibens]KII12587.1 hypothetical protein OO25_17010 [Phaeobacter sp. S60]